MRLRILLVCCAALALVVGMGTGGAAAATNGKVLILDSTVVGGATSKEGQAAVAAGRGVDVVTSAQWSAMTTAQFASYDAIVLGDPNCGTDPSPVAAAEGNAAVWSAAVNGNVVVMGVDASYQTQFHSSATTLINNSLAFAVAKSGSTGLFVSLSCYYFDASPGTAVPALSQLSPSGTFTVSGQLESASGCPDAAHIVATSPVVLGLTDADLSNWGCSTHEAFDTFPSDFTVVALNRDMPATFTAADSSTGGPYILTREGTATDPVPAQLSALYDVVKNTPPGKSLGDKVKQIQAYVAANNKAGACAGLNDFINLVKAQKGKKLTNAQAADYTAQANAIKTNLGC